MQSPDSVFGAYHKTGGARPRGGSAIAAPCGRERAEEPRGRASGGPRAGRPGERREARRGPESAPARGAARRRGAGEAGRALAGRRRFAGWGLLLAVVVAAALSWWLLPAPLDAAVAPGTAVELISVEQGDTLWSIAESHPIEGLTTRQCVQWIAASNGIEGSVIVPGQAIAVPAARTQAL